MDKCRLCNVALRSIREREVQDSILGQTENFLWVPGLGAFIEGYSLIISKSHVLNTGALDGGALKELESFIKKVKKSLYDIYHANPIVFEHGTMGNSRHAGSCVEHQHLHIFPVSLPDVPLILLQNFKDDVQVKSIKDLANFNQDKIPYIYYETSNNIKNVFEAPILPRQYMRQVVAKEIGCCRDWDWREKPFLESIKVFVSKVRSRTPAINDGA